MKNARTIWFTGLPSSGKTTLAKRLKEEFNGRVELLDGDTIRDYINNKDFSKEGRLRHLDYIILLSEILNRNGITVLCSFVSPYEETRERARELISDYYEVYVKCSVDECIKRDVKGMYKKALSGEIKGFTGIDAPYEEPKNPDLILDTDRLTIEQCLIKLMVELQ